MHGISMEPQRPASIGTGRAKKITGGAMKNVDKINEGIFKKKEIKAGIRGMAQICRVKTFVNERIGT